MRIQTGKTLDDTSRMRMETDQLYLKNEPENLTQSHHPSASAACSCKESKRQSRIHPRRARPTRTANLIRKP